MNMQGLEGRCVWEFNRSDIIVSRQADPPKLLDAIENQGASVIFCYGDVPRRPCAVLHVRVQLRLTVNIPYLGATILCRDAWEKKKLWISSVMAARDRSVLCAGPLTSCQRANTEDASSEEM